jgi:periplasmic protein TonB
MRKVYQSEKHPLALPVAIFTSVGFTALLFGFIPFAHRINRPRQVLELRSTRTVDLPPPVEDTPPPPRIEEAKPPEAPPEPELADSAADIPISASLDLVLGGGGGVVDAGEIRSLTTVEAVKDDTFDVTDLEKRPEAVSQVAPAYPPGLRKAKIEGSVTLIFVLNEEGRVEDPRVEKSSRPEFEKPSLDAIRKWRFSPGEKDGKPVRTYIRIPMRFRVPSA